MKTKRILCIFILMMTVCAVHSQQLGSGKSSKTVQEPKVFTVVYATSSDGFLNVRQQPTTKSKVLTKLYQMFHGLGNGVLRETGKKWSRVSVGTTTGWVYNKYLGYLTWYDGKGKHTLVANRDDMPIYGEDYIGDGDMPLFTTVKKGTVIADQYEENEEYYLLTSGHDYLFIKKKDVVSKSHITYPDARF